MRRNVAAAALVKRVPEKKKQYAKKKHTQAKRNLLCTRVDCIPLNASSSSPSYRLL